MVRKSKQSSQANRLPHAEVCSREEQASLTSPSVETSWIDIVAEVHRNNGKSDKSKDLGQIISDALDQDSDEGSSSDEDSSKVIRKQQHDGEFETVVERLEAAGAKRVLSTQGKSSGGRSLSVTGLTQNRHPGKIDYVSTDAVELDKADGINSMAGESAGSGRRHIM